MKLISSFSQLFQLNESLLASISKYYCTYSVFIISGLLAISRRFARHLIVMVKMGEEFRNKKCKMIASLYA